MTQVVDELILKARADIAGLQTAMAKMSDVMAAAGATTASAMGKTEAAADKASASVDKAGKRLIAFGAAFVVIKKSLNYVTQAFKDVTSGANEFLPASTRANLLEFSNTLEKAQKQARALVLDGINNLVPGFNRLIEVFREVTADTQQYTLLTEGLSYVFTILAVTLSKVVKVFRILTTSIDSLVKTAQVAWEALLGEGSDEEILNRIDSLVAGMEENKEKITGLFSEVIDPNEFSRAISKTYDEIDRIRKAKAEENTDDGQASIQRRTLAALLEQYKTHLRAETDALREQTALKRAILADNYATESALTVAVEAEKARIRQQHADEDLQRQVQQRAFYEQNWQAQYQHTRGILTDMSVLMESHSKRAFKIGKAAAIAQAVVDTISSAQSAYKAMSGIPIVGPALGAAAAAAAIAAGAVRVQQIKRTQFSEGASVGGSSGGAVSTPGTGGGSTNGPASQSNVNVTLVGERGYSANQIRGLMGAISQQAGDNVKIKVN